MAKRKRPPVNRKRQAEAARTLTAEVVPPRTVSMATIAELRKERIRKQGVVRTGVVTSEFGASGTMNIGGRIMREDYNPIFDGANGLVLYDQMERSDAQCGAAVDIIRLPIRGARFRAIPPEKATAKETLIAESLQQSLFEPGAMLESWDDVLRGMLLRVHFGFSIQEKIWTFDEDEGLLRWRRLAQRLPRTVEAFDVNPDGTLKAIRQRPTKPGTGEQREMVIPADYCLLSVREKEGDNYFGRSVLRRVYKHWWYKDEAYRIDGVRLDRFGVGVPVAKIEAGHVLEDDELAEIENTLIALRSHERAYIVEPPLVTFRIMVPEGGHGGVTGLMESVQHHDAQIVRAVLATFLSDHSEGLNTNRTKTLAEIFLQALKAETRGITSDIDRQLVRPFCQFNFDMSDARFPVIEVTGLGDVDIETQSNLAVALAGAKLLQPDDTIEDALRKGLGFAPLLAGYKRGDTKPVAPPVSSTTDENADNPEAGTLNTNAGPDNEAIAAGIAESVKNLELAVQDFMRTHGAPIQPVLLSTTPEPSRTRRKIIERDKEGRISAVVED